MHPEKTDKSIWRRRRTLLGSVTTLVVLSVAVFTVSAMVTWLGDDVDYAFFIRDSIWNSYGPVDSSFYDFFSSQTNHYLTVNGRYVAHTLVQFFCGVAGQWAFAACNAVVYPFFVIMLMKVAGIRRPLRHTSTVAGLSALVIVTFVTKMMPTTQIGFVWMFLLNLLWLRCLLKGPDVSGMRRWRRVAVYAVLLLLSVAAGNGQEAISIGLAGATGLWWLSRKGRVGRMRMLLLAGYWSGTLAICLSPGTLGRAADMHISLGDSLLYIALSLRMTYVLLAVVLWQLWRNVRAGLHEGKESGVRVLMTDYMRRLWKRNRLYLAAMAILLLFNLTVGVYSNRQLFGIELCAVIVILRILPGRRVTMPWACLAIAMAVVVYIFQYQGIQRVNRQYREIERSFVRGGGSTIYYDRTLAFTNPFMRQFRYYEEVVGQFNNDPHHSLQKKLYDLYPKLLPVQVRPALLRDLPSVSDRVTTFGPRQFVVWITDFHEGKVVIDSHIPFVPGSERSDTTDIPRTTVFGRKWKAAIINTAPSPFAVVDTVRIVYPREPK